MIPTLENEDIKKWGSYPLKDKKDLAQVNEASYKPVESAPFTKNDSVPFFFVTSTFRLVEEVDGKDSANKKKEMLINMFDTIRQLRP